MIEETKSQESHQESNIEELIQLRHFKDSVLGLWCIDQDPKQKSIEWIRENAFQLS